MRISLRSVYKRLPVVRELRAIQYSLNRIADKQCNRKLLETSAIIQALEAIKSSDPRYHDLEVPKDMDLFTPLYSYWPMFSF